MKSLSNPGAVLVVAGLILLATGYGMLSRTARECVYDGFCQPFCLNSRECRALPENVAVVFAQAGENDVAVSVGNAGVAALLLGLIARAVQLSLSLLFKNYSL